MSKEKWVAIEDTINLIDDHIEIRNCCAEYVCKKLNEKDQRIAELEEQLANAIVPKFKIGQEVWYTSDTNKVLSFTITKIGGLYFRYYDDKGFWLHEDELFTTEEEAKAKLEELKNG